jgi:hypothetical protein
VLACADPAGNRLADLPRANDNSDIAHDSLISCGPGWVMRTVTACASGPVT